MLDIDAAEEDLDTRHEGLAEMRERDVSAGEEEACVCTVSRFFFTRNQFRFRGHLDRSMSFILFSYHTVVPKLSEKITRILPNEVSEPKYAH